MQIVLTSRGSQTNTQEYMHAVFAHISHLIGIESIQFGPASPGIFGGQTVIINCKPQGTTVENEGLAKIVAEVVRLHEDLVLEKINIIPAYLLEAIKAKAPDVYEIDRYFAEFAANHDEYCKNLQAANVKRVTVEYVTVGANTISPTGKIATHSQGNDPVSFDPTNAYHCFAAALLGDPKLKNRFKNVNGIQNVHMVLGEGKVSIDFITVATHTVPLPQPAPAAANVNGLVSAFDALNPFVVNLPPEEPYMPRPAATRH